MFDFGGNKQYVERIDAVPYQRQISLSLTIRSCSVDCFWSGPMSKVANIRPDGNSTGNFAHSSIYGDVDAPFGSVPAHPLPSTMPSITPCWAYPNAEDAIAPLATHPSMAPEWCLVPGGFNLT
jgi:hypothetical protein